MGHCACEGEREEEGEREGKGERVERVDRRAWGMEGEDCGIWGSWCRVEECRVEECRDLAAARGIFECGTSRISKSFIGR